jgi:hypothetical protein
MVFADSHDTYAEQAISIRALAARAQLLHIAVLYEKLSLVLRDAALHSLVRMASTLRRTHQ